MIPTKNPESWKSVYADWRKKVNNRSEMPGEIKIVNEANPAELMIYDEIGYWGVTATNFVQALQDIKGDFTLHINSPGGDVFDALAIYNAIRAHDGVVTAQIDGLAASAASFICMACDTIVASDSCMMMIHDAIGMAMGNASDMQKMCEVLDKSSQQIAAIYAKHCGNTADYWRGLMKDESWFTANEAVDCGLADEMTNPVTLTNKVVTTIDDTARKTATDVPAQPLVKLVIDAGSVFKYAMADATKEPDAPELPPFTLDPSVFRAVLEECTNHAPAVPEPPREPKPAIKSNRISLSELADALKEGLR